MAQIFDKTASTLLVTVSIAVASALAMPAGAQQPPAPPLVRQLNNGNWLPQSEAESLRATTCCRLEKHPPRISLTIRTGEGP